MRRPPHPLPHRFRNLTRNLKTGLYEITEDGVTYHLEMKHINSLKASKSQTILAWFKSLDLRTKNEIIRVGNIEPDDFYPDVERED